MRKILILALLFVSINASAFWGSFAGLEVRVSGATGWTDTNSPVAIYYMQDTNAAPVIVDSSGNGYDGTPQPSVATGPTYTNVGTRVNASGDEIARGFDGIDDYISTTNDFSALSSESFTYSAWVRLNTVSPERHLFGAIEQQGGGPAATDPVLQCRVDATTGAVKFRIRGDGSSNLPEVDMGVSPVWGAGANWRHVVCIRDVATDKIYIYIDGIVRASETDTTTGNIDLDSTPVVVGASNVRGVKGNFWTGEIDDFRYYQKALASNEVWDVYFNTGYTNHSTLSIEEYLTP